MRAPVLVFLDPAHLAGRVVDANAPQLYVSDLGVVRGDGIFETLLATDGAARKLQAHLDRLASSADALDLDIPGPETWTSAIKTGLTTFGEPDAVVKLVATRGLEGTGRPTCWVQVGELATHEPSPGVNVLLLDRGYDSEAAERAPWLLLGAKTLSYAVNMAALRHAKANGADDVIFISSDSRVLEGPTSSVLLAHREGTTKRLITPELDSGILPGTTQHALFDAARQAGWELGYGPLVPADIFDADAVWLASSVRGIAPVLSADGEPLSQDANLTAELQDMFRRIS